MQTRADSFKRNLLTINGILNAINSVSSEARSRMWVLIGGFHNPPPKKKLFLAFVIKLVFQAGAFPERLLNTSDRRVLARGGNVVGA